MSPSPPDGVPGHRAVENLIAAYAERVDGGDFAGVGALLADAAFVGTRGTWRGADEIAAMFRATVLLYEDGTPRTRHVTTNLAVEADEAAGTARSRAYYTVFQAVPGLPLQAIAVGRYHDAFERRNGRWRFTERRIFLDLTGDVSRHLRRPDLLPPPQETPPQGTPCQGTM